MGDTGERDAHPQGETNEHTSPGAANITGGADRAGRGGTADAGQSTAGDTGVRETGDISGASSTHAGAGGVMENTGGTGTAPTGDVP
jgi:hypothetical protein